MQPPARAMIQEKMTPEEAQAAAEAAYLKPPNRAMAYIELLLAVAVIFALDLAFGPLDGFETVNPNPYWIPVIRLSVQYGVFEGLTAATQARAMLWRCLSASDCPLPGHPTPDWDQLAGDADHQLAELRALQAAAAADAFGG